ncbi:hypothetical protein GCM10009663_04850 [Kitasatospora arboriphila]|uniref:Uncharacterized protein n=1 Tax=Kitasatospora arboriphila TaxID=258052 RepID=A0ABN1TA81_9ACTN
MPSAPGTISSKFAVVSSTVLMVSYLPFGSGPVASTLPGPEVFQKKFRDPLSRSGAAPVLLGVGAGRAPDET